MREAPSRAGRRPGRRALVLWTLLRLPMLAALLYAARVNLLTFAESRIGLAWPTETAIIVLSTLRERVVLFALCLAVLAVGWMLLAKRIRTAGTARAIYFALSLTLFLGIFRASAGLLVAPDVVVALLLGALLVVNVVPRATAREGRQEDGASRRNDVFFGCAIGSELLLPGYFLPWLARQLGDQSPVVRLGRRLIPGWLPSVAAASFVAVAFLNASAWAYPVPAPPRGLAELRRALFADPAVTQFAHGNFDMLALDAARDTLYATGHGVPRLVAYDVHALHRSPRATPVNTGRAGEFAYDPTANELYVFNSKRGRLLVLDGTTLRLRRSFPLEGISPGDNRILWDGGSGQLFILSEADQEVGFAFVVANGRTGEIIQRLINIGSDALLDPSRKRIYATDFRRQSQLFVYDTERHEIVRTLATDPRINGLILDESTDQLLLGSPLNSAINRYDAETLERLEDLGTVFGVRHLAIDAKRHLLLCISLATNTVDVIDLDSEQSVARYRVAPWLRKVAVDADAGVAYVSSKYGLFRVRYTERLRAER